MGQNTIGAMWKAADGRPAGFDYLRIFLAVSVILWHTSVVCHGRASETWMWTGPLRPFGYIVVPSFFSLSGFLVAGSLMRNDTISFATLRVIRIFPALVFEVIISALMIGPLVTTLTWPEYFSDREFFTYFLNTIGDIHYKLPGVFPEVPFARMVNVQLWTIPFELQCYIALVLFALFRLHRSAVLFLIVTTILNILWMWQGGGLINPLTPLDNPPPGRLLVLCFLYGVFFFIVRDKIVYKKWIVATCLSAFAVLVYSTTAVFIVPALVAYVTIALGVWNWRFPPILRLSDYSYGVYLYGFPI